MKLKTNRVARQCSSACIGPDSQPYSDKKFLSPNRLLISAPRESLGAVSLATSEGPRSIEIRLHGGWLEHSWSSRGLCKSVVETYPFLFLWVKNWSENALKSQSKYKQTYFYPSGVMYYLADTPWWLENLSRMIHCTGETHCTWANITKLECQKLISECNEILMKIIPMHYFSISGWFTIVYIPCIAGRAFWARLCRLEVDYPLMKNGVS